MLSTLLAMEISMKIDAKILGGASCVIGCTTFLRNIKNLGKIKRFNGVLSQRYIITLFWHKNRENGSKVA